MSWSVSMNKRELFKEELQELLGRYKESLAAPTIIVIAQRVFNKTLSIKSHPELYKVDLEKNINGLNLEGEYTYVND